MLQHGASEHAGVAFGAQQLPAAGFPQPTPHTPQLAWARDAQSASHDVLQQKGSIAQTSWQQEGSMHPRPACAKQQLPWLTPHCAYAGLANAKASAQTSAAAIATRSVAGRWTKPRGYRTAGDGAPRERRAMVEIVGPTDGTARRGGAGRLARRRVVRYTPAPATGVRVRRQAASACPPSFVTATIGPIV